MAACVELGESKVSVWLTPASTRPLTARGKGNQGFRALPHRQRRLGLEISKGCRVGDFDTPVVVHMRRMATIRLFFDVVRKLQFVRKLLHHEGVVT